MSYLEFSEDLILLHRTRKSILKSDKSELDLTKYRRRQEKYKALVLADLTQMAIFPVGLVFLPLVGEILGWVFKLATLTENIILCTLALLLFKVSWIIDTRMRKRAERLYGTKEDLDFEDANLM